MIILVIYREWSPGGGQRESRKNRGVIAVFRTRYDVARTSVAAMEREINAQIWGIFWR